MRFLPASRLLALRIPPPRLTRQLIGVSAMGLVVLGWWFVTSGLGSEDRLVSPIILPSPAEVFRSFPSLLNDRALMQSIAATLKRVLIGFGLAALVGVPLGIAAGSWRVIEAAGAPLALFGRNLPVAALIPLGASGWQIVRKVLVPLALPDIYGSLRHLFGLAFGYIMLAELINAQHGLGYLLMASQRRGMSEHIILILMIIGLLAYGIDRVLFWFQRGLFPYRVVED
jgi:ABC-type nitrate/sulfonate/bicarbonate transport system permease component